MKTRADVHAEVMHAVFEDRDPSVESAVDRGIEAGIAYERARIGSILDLSIPPGLRRAVLMLALNSDSTIEQVAGFIQACAAVATAPAEFRKTFRVVPPSPEGVPVPLDAANPAN